MPRKAEEHGVIQIVEVVAFDGMETDPLDLFLPRLKLQELPSIASICKDGPVTLDRMPYFDDEVVWNLFGRDPRTFVEVKLDEQVPVNEVGGYPGQV